MYFESVFFKPNNFHINICDIKLSKKFMKIAFFLASEVGGPVEYTGKKAKARNIIYFTCMTITFSVV